MNPEELKELIKATIEQITFWDKFIITLVPVVFTIVFSFVNDMFKSKQEFLKKYKIEQLKELYLPLYSIVAQSEYLKKVLGFKDDFEKVPFVEIKTTHSEEHWGSDGYSFKSHETQNDITKFNKGYIVELILKKQEFASTELIKLATALRFLLDNENVDDKKIKDKFDSENLCITCKIIKLIIQETNEKLKFCKMDYSKDELDKHIMKL